jgi:hypothetical protein
MTRFNAELWELAEQLFSPEQSRQMRLMVEPHPLKFDRLLDFDVTLGGACMSNVTDQNGTGQYVIEDRGVFRPLQYCAMYFYRKRDMREVEFFTRNIVQMSGLHIESLLNRIGGFLGFALGRALRDMRVWRRIDPVTSARIDKFRNIYNAAKHAVDHDKDTHLFSVEDAVLAYFVSRKLGEALYPLAKLRTSFTG